MQLIVQCTIITLLHGFRRQQNTDPFLSRKSGPWGNVIKIAKDFEEYNLMPNVWFQVDPSMPYSIRWTLDRTGIFTVRSCRYMWDDIALPQVSTLPTIWLKAVPSKVNITFWRAKLRKLPTFRNLRLRNVIETDPPCVFCKFEAESTEHVFFDCLHIRPIWKEVANWWNCDKEPMTFDELLNWSAVLGITGMAAEAFNALIMVMIWCIWRRRNEIFYNHTNDGSRRLFEEGTHHTFFWLRHRVPRKVLWCWGMWLTSPRCLFM
ncbi:hypothetical protein OROHE_003580 [Orobanche hederae]